MEEANREIVAKLPLAGTCKPGLAGVTDTVHGAEHNFGLSSEICATIWQRL